MKRFSQFIINPFERNPETLVATFHYHFDNEESFRETISFAPLHHIDDFPLVKNDKNQIFQLLAHLSIALGISYYKLFPTKEIIVHSLQLSKTHQQFWADFYLKGLGEFFYQNKLDPRGLAHFSNTSDAPSYKHKITFKAEKSLVLFGGGKDSLVTGELLKKQSQHFDLFSFGKDYPLHQIAQIPTGRKRLIIERNLDLWGLHKLLEKGYYNGHLPITGIISFVSLVVAYLYGYEAVISSLEKSADEGNTNYCAMPINHQRSKSSEFEQAFQNYVRDTLSTDFSFFSPLRKWYEIRIIQEFCEYPQYFHHFSSCNRNFHQTGSKLTSDQLRCGKCPKCAFVSTMMRAFIGEEKTYQIFGRDFFADECLIPLFEELLGISGIKPFECVGTSEEMMLAFRLILQREPEIDTPMATLFKRKILTQKEDAFFWALEKKLLW